MGYDARRSCGTRNAFYAGELDRLLTLYQIARDERLHPETLQCQAQGQAAPGEYLTKRIILESTINGRVSVHHSPPKGESGGAETSTACGWAGVTWLTPERGSSLGTWRKGKINVPRS